MVLRLLSVIGARPNFVKLAAIEPYLRKHGHIIVHTGQHYDYELSRVFFEHLEVPEPDYYLGVGSGSHGYQVGEMVKGIEEVLLKERPDVVIVYGDTNSTLAGALAAVKAGFPVAHVEAGLRSFDMRMPEEINRRVTDHVSDLLFAPTRTAVENLRRESVIGSVYLTGDVHVDILNRSLPIAERRSRIVEELDLESYEYIVATVHRAENTDDPARLARIVEILLSAAEKGPVVLPLHPRTRKALEKIGLLTKLESGVKVVKPLGYLDFVKLLRNSKAVITDSGGVQREAYLLGVPCLVLRNRTEWVELVELGWVRLVDVNPDLALGELRRVLEDPPRHRSPVLGTGDAARRITEILEKHVEEDKGEVQAGYKRPRD